MINMTEFAANVPNLRSKDQGFASSLISQFSSKNSLSNKQWYWVKKLANTAKHGYEPAPVAAEGESMGEFGGIFEMLQTANANIKYPKIRLATKNGQSVVLKINSPRSRSPGQISITDGRRYGEDGVYFGRIDGQGIFVAGMRGSANLEVLEDVKELLRRMSQDPAGTASEYGRFTGQCCFCRHELGHGDDRRSIEVGYGPTCAKTFGLSWGE